MNGNMEPGILSPLSQYLQDGGSQQTSMGTPRPGTPRGSHFRLSPDGNMGNPGTPGAVHDLHKFPNSPWNGSEPATPGYSRHVVPSSPYIPSYPNTPATPGSSFYQKPGGVLSNGNAAVPPGSPWTERSVCTPGPMTPMTPATPLLSNGSDHNGYGSNNGSPTFIEHGHGGKSQLAGLLQDSLNDSLVPVMNPVETGPPSLAPPAPLHHLSNGGAPGVVPAQALPNLQIGISDTERSLAVDDNPNLISEFEDFLAKYISSRKNEDSGLGQQEHAQHNLNLRQQQPPPQYNPPPPPPSQNPMRMENGGGKNGGMMYHGNMMINNGQHMSMNNHHNMLPGQIPSSAGPMRGNNLKFPAQPPMHHPFARNLGMMQNRQVPMHMQHSNQYTNTATGPQNQGVSQPPHLPQGSMGMMHPQTQFDLQGGNHPSASLFPPSAPPSNNGGYLQQPPMHQHMPTGPYGNVQAQQQQSPHSHWPPPMSNHSMMGPNGNSHMVSNTNPGVNAPSRGIPQQTTSYFQTPVSNNPPGSIGGGNDHSVNSNTLSSAFPFDLNQGMVNGGGNGNLGMNPGTNSAMHMSTPMGMGVQQPPPQQQNQAVPTPPVEELNNIDLDGPYDGSNLSQATWSKALDKVSRTNPVAEVGKVLFDDIFTDDEVIQCTLSGRGSSQKFNPNKVHYLKKAVAWLMQKPSLPWEFNLATCEANLNQDDESVRGLEKKVFTEYRSRRRGDILKTRTPLPPS